MNFLSFFLSIHRAQQSRSGSLWNVDGHQMYFGGSVVGNASTYRLEISPTPPLIFTGVNKCEICRRFQHHSTLSRPRLKMQQDIHVTSTTRLSKVVVWQTERHTYIQTDTTEIIYHAVSRVVNMSYSWVGTR